MIKLRRVRWAVHVAQMGESRDAYRVFVGKPEGSNHLEDPDVNGRVILTLIFRNWEGGMDWIDLAKNRDRWCALVHTVMNLWVP
jgi:hypothetical protein